MSCEKFLLCLFAFFCGYVFACFACFAGGSYGKMLSDMPGKEIKLVRPTPELREEFWDMARDCLAAGEERHRPALDNFEAYLGRLAFFERGIDLGRDRVPSSEFWLTDGRRILGRSTLRHRLNANLENEGGHIGYDIRPSERGKGYGTLILKLTLEEARKRGINRAFVTCDADNIASAKIIERNGGVLAGRDISRISGKEVSQYWIEI